MDARGKKWHRAAGGVGQKSPRAENQRLDEAERLKMLNRAPPGKRADMVSLTCDPKSKLYSQEVF